MPRKIHKTVALLIGLSAAVALAGNDRPTRFTDIGGIVNTRHNMTQSTMSNGQGVQMNSARNDYGQVCVYCHTPHGANSQINAPLWNRTYRATAYNTYDLLGTSTLTQPISQPGKNSLPCLSCHDGQTAIDSIINMPGSGLYNKNQETATAAASNAFLNSWAGTGATDSHMGFTSAANTGGNTDSCLTCHVPGTFANATDFRAFVIGTDLTNDHPVGVRFPLGNPDFKQPGGTQGNALYFEVVSNSHMDSNEIRLYDTGEGPEVECASCHDPHGVPSGGAGTAAFKSFLRVNNDSGTGVCMTCHNK
jgi:hypothetical protein